jgi:predicted HTH domain antitoxin
MTTLTMQLPDEALAATRSDPTGFARELRVAAAALWYSEGRVSQEVAAEIAGLDRTDFLLALARMGRDVFVVDPEDLDRELRRG